MQPFKKILSPIDFSDPSRSALDVAADMAKRFDAELWLVHVVPAIPKLDAPSEFFKEREYEDRLHQEAVNHLQTLADNLAKQGIKTKTEVGTANDAAMELVRIAEHNAIDLIVIATHGMSGWHKLVFGSVTEKVVRVSHCPVLILRAEAAAASAKTSA